MMRYIFPQIKGLGHSETSEYYAISDKNEAEAYLRNRVLGERLPEIMTLFAAISSQPVFQQVLDKFFDGQQDVFTRRAIL